MTGRHVVVALLLAAGCRHAGPATWSAPEDERCMTEDELAAAASSMGATMDEKTRKKLAPALRRLHERLTKAAHAARAKATTAPDEAKAADLECIPPSVWVVVMFTGPLADLEAAGLMHAGGVRDSTGGVYDGEIATSRLEALVSVPHVQWVEPAPKAELLLNRSAPEVGAPGVWSNGLKGKGVVIGIIDSGIDWSHKTFTTPKDPTKPDGEQASRIIAIWDQTLTAQPGETGHMGSGVVYTRADIEKALRGEMKLRTEDAIVQPGGRVGGHGTHVAGIAAGGGSPGDCCASGNTYVGIAPEAELIVVRLRLDTVAFPAALEWIEGQVTDKPLVVNLSMGFQLSAGHDGTHISERAIQKFVTSRPGRVMVVAAGNDKLVGGHAQVSVPAGKSVDVTFEVAGRDVAERSLDFWYPGSAQLGLEVFAPNGRSGAVAHGGDTKFIANPDAPAAERIEVQIDGTASHPSNNDNNYVIEFVKSAGTAMPKGEWKLRFTNAGAADVELHGWMIGGGAAGRFSSHVKEDTTLTIPSTTPYAITVANYVVPHSVPDPALFGKLYTTSGRGPARSVGGAAPPAYDSKPDLAAPGTLIKSAKAHPNCCQRYVAIFAGTSQAAPHVTGAVALMLEQDPKLDWNEAKMILRENARPAPDVDVNGWGSGKLAVDRVIAFMRGEPLPALAMTGSAPAPVARIAPATIVMATMSSRTRSVIDDAQLATAPPQVAPSDLLGALQAVLQACARGVPDGELCAALLSRHFSEGRRLVNTNRRVATMWHRADGPKMIRRVLTGVADASAPAPIETATQREYLQNLLALLREHGGPTLAAAIDAHGARMLRLLERPIAAQFTESSARVAS